MDKKIYREKTIEKISSPEQLDDFIQVARPSIWFVLAAIVLLIIGAAVWASFGVIEVTEANGYTHAVHPIEFVIN